MIFKPAQLGMAKLDQQELVEDKKSCKKIGPCGVGKKALYLNSFTSTAAIICPTAASAACSSGWL